MIQSSYGQGPFLKPSKSFFISDTRLTRRPEGDYNYAYFGSGMMGSSSSVRTLTHTGTF